MRFDLRPHQVIAVAELGADAGRAPVLRAWRGDPYHAAGHGNGLWLIHEPQQPEHFVVELVFVHRGHEPAIGDEWHVSRVQGVAVSDGEGERILFCGDVDASVARAQRP